jgi:hypothetical protein
MNIRIYNIINLQQFLCKRSIFLFLTIIDWIQIFVLRPQSKSENVMMIKCVTSYINSIVLYLRHHHFAFFLKLFYKNVEIFKKSGRT